MKANDSSTTNNRPQKVILQGNNIWPREIHSNEFTMKQVSSMCDGMGSTILCTGDVELTLRRPRFMGSLATSLQIDVDNFIDKWVEAAIIIQTSTRKTLIIMNVTVHPKSGIEYRTAWDWLEKIVSVDVDFDGSHSRLHYLNKYPDIKQMTYQNLTINYQWKKEQIHSRHPNTPL